MAHSIALWMKTPEASKKMALLYFGPILNPSRKDTLQVLLQNGELFQFSANTRKFQLAPGGDTRSNSISSCELSINLAIVSTPPIRVFQYATSLAVRKVFLVA